MVGLFCFDGPMYCDVDGVYCNTTITNNVFERYLKVAEVLFILIRTIHLDISYKDAKLHEVKLDRLKIIECPNLNTPKGLLLEKNNVNKFIVEYLKKTDLIFARMPSIISNMVLKWAIKMKKPYLVEVGGCAWDSYVNHSFLGKCIAPKLYYDEKKYVRKADFAVYVTEKWLQKRYPNKNTCEFCSNVFLSSFSDETLVRRLKKIKKNNADHVFVIGTAAAVNVKYKGQEYIIKAISKLNKQGYNFEYELAGAGDNQYLSLIAEKYGVLDKVHFKGLLLHDEVMEWLDCIDIYAQPSKQEGLPRALIEAMSRACPSIGSTTAGIPELLESNQVFKPNDINHICQILKTITEPEEMQKQAKNNYEKSKEYDSLIIEKRRTDIFGKYAKQVKLRRCTPQNSKKECLNAYREK